MTRFARAKGSKASNERLPEQATSWTELKTQLLEKKKEQEESEARKKAEQQRNANYKAFLKERDEQVKPSEWSEFPEATNQELNKTKKPNKKVPESSLKKKTGKKLEKNGKKLEKKRKKLEKNAKTLDKTGKKLDKIADNFKNDIAKPLGNVLSESDGIVEGNGDDSDEAPMEVSAKVEVPEVHIKQKKQKQKKLKIVIDRESKKKATSVTSSPKQVSENKPVKENKELTEAELKKIEKKKQKRLKQLEKKKKAKETAKAEKTNEEAAPENPKQVKEGGPGQKTNKTDEAVPESAKQVKGSDPGQKKPQKRKTAVEQNDQNAKKPKPDQKDPNGKKPKFDQKDPNGKKLKKSEDGKFQRKKPQMNSMIINGKEVPISYFDGFPIKREDSQRLSKLRREMISKGLPRSEIEHALKLERRKAEKAFAREKKKVCFNCRKSGHNLSECPDLDKNEMTSSSGTGICFKCGSTEHTHFECRVVRGPDYKFATCFICNEQGHISKQCPDNARGLYPKGGACRECGDVTHLKRDCPKYQAQQERESEKLDIGTMNGDNPDNLDVGSGDRVVKPPQRSNKIIKF